jgi:hypothetical protein
MEVDKKPPPMGAVGGDAVKKAMEEINAAHAK